MLPGHEGLVTCVRYMHDELLVSADDKGILKLWKNDQPQVCKSCLSRTSITSTLSLQWHSHVTRQAHKTGIASLAVHERYIVTGASDGIVKVWAISEDDPGKYPVGWERTPLNINTPLFTENISEVQEINVKKGFPVSLALAILPGTKCMLHSDHACLGSGVLNVAISGNSSNRKH